MDNFFFVVTFLYFYFSSSVYWWTGVLSVWLTVQYNLCKPSESTHLSDSLCSWMLLSTGNGAAQ